MNWKMVLYHISIKYAVSTVAVAAVVALWGSIGVVSAIDRLPLIARVFELVGIGYSEVTSIFFFPSIPTYC
ncbi:hypothetical protein QN277_015615 [Acacia crassicarpa]|uniref:Cyanobacterial aminoacyl-tRNA synthetase CAAD domain-containing protein n=1 Tax=Acacia crassicarpa TaxID=499986 RepID=A0AAE1JYU3_9FABA|nr:hypothetical protein QN277_015615 [Acacia crassicarpa]